MGLANFLENPRVIGEFGLKFGRPLLLLPAVFKSQQSLPVVDRLPPLEVTHHRLLMAAESSAKYYS